METFTNSAVPDDQLIYYILNNDPTALETLVYLNKDKIYQTIFSVIQDKHQSDEIFQNVFIQINNSLISGKPMEGGKFLSWAISIATNMCITHLRKAKYTSLMKVSDDTMYIPPVVNRNFMNHEQHNEIRRMINMLPDEEREIIVLKHYADLSFKEIADMMKCTLNTVLSRMRFALTTLHRIMQEKQMALSA